MKKIILIGRVAAGKTTLTQAIRGEEIKYFKTQYVNYLDTVIDTPGEYTELRQPSGALACIIARTSAVWQSIRAVIKVKRPPSDLKYSIDFKSASDTVPSLLTNVPSRSVHINIPSNFFISHLYILNYFL